MLMTQMKTLIQGSYEAPAGAEQAASQKKLLLPPLDFTFFKRKYD
jgi:hypothetical protein